MLSGPDTDLKLGEEPELLYLPGAARAFAAGDYSAIHHLYAQTAGWMAVVTFPIFALTFGLAQPLTTLLYGARYEQSGVILAWLAFGYYFRIMFGFNELTLKALGKLQYVLTLNIIGVLITVVINVLLISRYGAIGAAIGTTGSMVVHSILSQAGLQRALGFNIFNRQYVWLYLMLAAGAGSLFGIKFLNDDSFLDVPLVGLVTMAVFLLTRKELGVIEMFPEVRKLPLLGKFFV